MFDNDSYKLGSISDKIKTQIIIGHLFEALFLDIISCIERSFQSKQSKYFT